VADWGDGVSASTTVGPMSISVGSGWPHNPLRHHWLMPISCHFLDCKVLLVTSLTHVSGPVTSVQAVPLPLLSILASQVCQKNVEMWMFECVRH